VTESTVEQYAASTNGHVHFEGAPAPERGDDARNARPVSALILPLALIIVALVVLRRMQRGNYA
jgi:hypothetical protein